MPFIVDEDDFRRDDASRFDDRDRFELDMRNRDNEERRRRDLEQRERDEDDRRALTVSAEADLQSALEKATSEEMRMLVNDPTLRVSSRGRITRTRPSGRDLIRSSGQFAMQGFDLPKKKPRKKNKKHCSNLSSCLRQANSELRTKRGALRKGKTQADIMRRAQRLLKKMK
ncbi:MAG: hypothetical protein [Circular genetic element sp.]|nr:MAG: hypothetical protein [Circular genetic element sp.]